MNNLINDTNYRIADAIFYSNDGGMQVDEFASAISDAMNGWYCISNFNMDSDEIASYMVDIQGHQVAAYNGR